MQRTICGNHSGWLSCISVLVIFYLSPCVVSWVRLPVFNLHPALSLKAEGGCSYLFSGSGPAPTSVCTSYYVTSAGSWGNLCTNSMFQQKLLICVMSVVGRENAHFLVIPFSTSQGGMFWDVGSCRCFSWNNVFFFKKMWLQIKCAGKKKSF